MFMVSVMVRFSFRLSDGFGFRICVKVIVSVSWI